MTRAPELGQVKTRLAATHGAERALAVHSALGARVVESVTRSASWNTTIAFTPGAAREVVRHWLPLAVLEEQSAGNLGDRMRAAIERRFADGMQRVVVIGTDCPDVTETLIESAFEQLVRADVVLGPATDGGYYLIGVNASWPELFHDVPWSSPLTLAVTLERALAAGLVVVELPEYEDIDDGPSLDRLEARVGPVN